MVASHLIIPGPRKINERYLYVTYDSFPKSVLPSELSCAGGKREVKSMSGGTISPWTVALDLHGGKSFNEFLCSLAFLSVVLCMWLINKITA